MYLKYENLYKTLGFNSMTEIQEDIKVSNKNILIVSSCGSGKTEASYLKMIEYNRKTIFIEAMRTLANAIQERLNGYNEKLGLENVTIQHSSNQQDKFLKSKYCVTTIDQVLSGYLMFGRQSAIRGKNVLLSNLIFDEVQLFDCDTLLLTTINMLDEIYKLGIRFIIMTATMPQYLIDFFSKRYDMDVFISEKNRNDRCVNLFYEESLDYEKVINYDHKQIIICNTVEQLKEVKKNLPKSRVITFHSVFLESDKEVLEKKIYKYFGKKSSDNNMILLTTSIIEVGIDISCSRLYTTACGIDNLIQRDGRCCRWGGYGEVIVFKNHDNIYDAEVVNNTVNKIKEKQGIDFKWSLQKEWINEIMNPYYRKKVTDELLSRNKHKFSTGSRRKLIRDIDNVNIIVCNKEDYTKDDFRRESVSIYRDQLKNIAKTNELYVLEKGNIKQVSINQIEIGDTVMIRGNNCMYNDEGFSYDKNAGNGQCKDFPESKVNDDFDFKDYIEEPWINHALAVKEKLAEKIEEDRFNQYTIDKSDEIAFYGGLHDLGKLDLEFCKRYESLIPLAHFPFVKGYKTKVTNALISGEILRDIIDDKIIYNMIIQHHGRVYTKTNNMISDWNMHKDVYKILEEYGLKKKILVKGERRYLNKHRIITPADDEWTTLLYLIGTFMECEIQAINDYRESKKYNLN